MKTYLVISKPISFFNVISNDTIYVSAENKKAAKVLGLREMRKNNFEFLYEDLNSCPFTKMKIIEVK